MAAYADSQPRRLMPSEEPMTRARSNLWRLERQRAKARSTQEQIDGDL